MKRKKLSIVWYVLLLLLAGACTKDKKLALQKTDSENAVKNKKTVAKTLAGFVHPGLLHTQADFDRMRSKVNANAQPWKSGWDKLVANARSQTSWTPHPTATVIRGGTGQNYSNFMNDIAAAYQSAVRWKVSGDAAYADQSIRILNAWSSTLTTLTGNADRFLAAGIYGYEFANAAEIMRTYSGWASADFTRFKNMMLNIFYPMNHDFLTNHNDACITNYWANWDLCNMASILAIGILCDDMNKYNEAITYFKTGAGNGSIDHAVPFLYNSGTLGQGQESGRDQGHQCLDISLLGAFCQMAYNQGNDLFAYENNKVLAVCEYTASYNLGNSVPFTTYSWGTGQNCAAMSQTVISSASRGDIRPSWELIYNHYQNLKGIPAVYSGQYAANVRPEGGGGDYGPNSGGYDQLGFGTLTYTLDPNSGGPIANGTYRLLNRASGKYLDNLGATSNGAEVGQWSSSTSNNQKWVVTYSGGYYKLSCVTGGKYLDDINHTIDGSTVAQWGSSSSQNQQWTITQVGSYYKVINRANGKCLDTGGGTANGDIMQFWYSGGSYNQQWSFVP